MSVPTPTTDTTSTSTPDADLHPFGGFLTTSPLSTKKRDSVTNLASNVIRDHFGVVVQAVADFMFTRPPNARLSFSADILKNMQMVCKREFHNERSMLVKRVKYLNTGINTGTINTAYRYHLNQTIGSSAEGYVSEPDLIRAALLVLIQQNIVTVHCCCNNKEDADMTYKYSYSISAHRACMLVRYPRYAEHSKGLYGNTKAAFIIEQILLHGRLRTNDIVMLASKAACEAVTNDDDDDVDVDSVTGTEPTPSDELKVEIFGILRWMIDWGHVEMVQPIDYAERKHEENQEEAEASFSVKDKENSEQDETEDKSTDESSNTRKRKLEIDVIKELSKELDPTVLEEIKKNKHDLRLTKILQPGAVWRVNVSMFHATIRSLLLGRLVAERYGKKVQNAGSLITAALKHLSHKRYSSKPTSDFDDDLDTFYPLDITKYLPTTVLEAYKKKQGGLQLNLSRAFVDLSAFDWPSCVVEIENHKGHTKGGKFEISTNSLLAHLRSRLTHRVLRDHLGELSSRIISVIESHGHLEPEQIGEYAMLPAKEARELLNTLYLNRYVCMANFQQTKQYNPNNALYTWYVDHRNLYQTIAENLYIAMTNLRLRKQHEMEIGKSMIERQQGSGGTENETNRDKATYLAFCKGLDRLDNAMLQLDESLIVMQEL